MLAYAYIKPVLDEMGVPYDVLNCRDAGSDRGDARL